MARPDYDNPLGLPQVNCFDFIASRVTPYRGCCCEACHGNPFEGYHSVISPDGKIEAWVCCRMHHSLVHMADQEDFDNAATQSVLRRNTGRVRTESHHSIEPEPCLVGGAE